MSIINDEHSTLVAGQFEPAGKQYGLGWPFVAKGKNHNCICSSPATMDAAKKWLEQPKLIGNQ